MVIRDYKYVVNSFSDMIKGIATLESHTTSSLPYIYNIHGSYLDSKHGYSETNYIYTRTYMTVNFVTGENVPTSWGNEDFNVNSIDDLKTYYKTYFDAIELAESDYRYVWSKITK